jgi:thiol:disulfide interchange protein DsbD
MKKNCFVFVVALLFALSGSAQILNPVKWTYAAEKSADGLYNIVFTAKIDKTWHLYGINIPEGGPVATSFTFNPSGDYELVGKTKEISKGEKKFDESFQMEVMMFSNVAKFVQKIKPKKSGNIEISGSLEFMCCDDSKCLPPKNEEFKITLIADEATTKTSKADDVVATIKPDSVISSENIETKNSPDTNATLVTNNAQTNATTKETDEPESVWGFFWYALVMGLLGVITPCVYPMIPMTVSFFMRDSSGKTGGLIKGLIFGLSVILIYTLIGVLVSLSIVSADIGNILSTHWIPNLLFFLLFVVFAASFFGMFEMVLPSSLVNKIDAQADKGGYMGAFFMALTLVIVSFSCTGPIVGKILIEASQGLALKPIAGMFGYSIAFALPFTLFAVFPSMLKNLPKSGGWLNSVKVFLGFIVLAFSLTFVTSIDQNYHLNLLSRDLFLIIWIVLTVLLGFYLLGKIKFSHDSDLPYVSVPRIFMVIVVFSFALYLFTGLFNAPLKSLGWILPVKEVASMSQSASNQINNASALCNTPKYSDFLHLPHGLKGYFDLNEGLACAREKNKPVFLDIKGHSCKNCKLVEAQVWSDPRVLKSLSEDFIIIALYVDEKKLLPKNEWYTSTYDNELKKSIGAKNLDFEKIKFNTNTQPLYAVLDHNGNVLGSPIGMNLDIETFLKFLEEGKEKFKNTK